MLAAASQQAMKHMETVTIEIKFILDNNIKNDDDP